eukprot:GDKH01002550.1.p2 GENE.GDKH01002550.1~~GDKH01002550.1.p2  ORF type:complete len:239 (+),score=92.24 GDKH01002550.1:48-764(+)
MKLNIADPNTALQKCIEIDDDRKLLPFFDKRIGSEVSGDSLGDEFKGYVFRITGGNDKQGFPMMQGILTQGRARLLFKDGMKTFRERRAGSFKRKSVRGCIVSSNLSVLSLIVVQKGEDIPGLTDDAKPARLGPKRANKIRKLFGLTKEDDVRKFVVRRELPDKKKKSKSPKIQRLITPERLQRKRRNRSLKKRHFEAQKKAAEEYKGVMESYKHEQKEKRAAEIAKKKKDLAKKAKA